MRKSGMGSHESSRMKNDEWITPKSVLSCLGEFDLDPCAPINRPWDTAKKHYTIEDDGLKQDWKGRVFCNPPYGAEVVKWLDKLAKHGDGIALIFARTETKMFFDTVWKEAHALLFIKGRLTFHHVSGEKASMNAGAPSVLVAYGKKNADALLNACVEGQYIPLC